MHSLGEISCFKDEIETELDKSRPRLRGIYAAYTKEIGLHLEGREGVSISTAVNLQLAACFFSVPDPQGFEVSSLAGDPEDPAEPEEDELQAAAEQLTQDFLCQVIHEEEVGGEGKRMEPNEPEEEEEKGRSLCQSAPLVAILGKLQTTASLDPQQEKADGEKTKTSTPAEGAAHTDSQCCCVKHR